MSDFIELFARWKEAQVKLREARIEEHDIHVQIARWMHENRAEHLESDGVEATYRPSIEWDRSILQTLAEHLSPQEFAAILTKPVDPVVDAAKAKRLAARGDPYRSIVERAQKPGTPELRIRRIE